ncbi:MAG: VWA domain-containing protein [Pirellulaceae bacterium]
MVQRIRGVGLFACCAVWLLLVLSSIPSATAQQNIVILLDDSGSMHETLRSNSRMRKMDAAKSAITTVLQQVPPDAQVGLAVLNGQNGPWVIPLGPLDTQKAVAAVKRIKASGGTPLGEHMKVAADALLEARQKQRYGTFKLLIITDGEANDGDLVERYLPDIQSRGIVVDAIGVDMPGQHSLATRTSSYRRADDPESLKKAISDVMAETTSDAGDAGQSDFELLQPLPPEVATAALTALSDVRNEPIAGNAAANSRVENRPPASNTPASGNPAPPARRDDDGGKGRLLFIGLIFGFLIFRFVTKLGKR